MFGVHLEYARRSRSENGRWLSHLPFLTRAGRSLQKAAKRESEFRNAVACRVKDSANWKSEACPESGYVSGAALGTFAFNQYEFETGIISSWIPLKTRVGWRMFFSSANRSPLNCSTPETPRFGRGNLRSRRSCLTGEGPEDRVGDRVGVLVKREVAAVEIAQFSARHSLLHELRGARE